MDDNDNLGEITWDDQFKDEDEHLEPILASNSSIVNVEDEYETSMKLAAEIEATKEKMRLEEEAAEEAARNAEIEKERHRNEAEAAAKAEIERLAAEELQASQQEQERLRLAAEAAAAAEAAEAAEVERLAAEEIERQQQEQEAAEQARQEEERIRIELEKMAQEAPPADNSILDDFERQVMEDEKRRQLEDQLKEEQIRLEKIRFEQEREDQERRRAEEIAYQVEQKRIEEESRKAKEQEELDNLNKLLSADYKETDLEEIVHFIAVDSDDKQTTYNFKRTEADWQLLDTPMQMPLNFIPSKAFITYMKHVYTINHLKKLYDIFYAQFRAEDFWTSHKVTVELQHSSAFSQIASQNGFQVFINKTDEATKTAEYGVGPNMGIIGFTRNLYLIKENTIARKVLEETKRFLSNVNQGLMSAAETSGTAKCTVGFNPSKYVRMDTFKEKIYPILGKLGIQSSITTYESGSATVDAWY